MMKKIVGNIVIFLFTVIIGCGFAEALLRVKNSDQKNYNIEMWRYAKLLKKKSNDPLLGHEHIPNRSAKLQGVDIRINSLGMRGPEPDLGDTTKKRILFLGSSNTFGWGVPEEKMMTTLLQNDLKDKAQILNAGIGNYNTVRYVNLFDKKLAGLKPDVVVLNCFVRDAEQLDSGRGNLLLQHSELAVTLFHLFQSLSSRYGNIKDLIAYYQKIYSHDSRGFFEMKAAFDRLDIIAKKQGFKVIFTMIPDIHKMQPYPFEFIHDEMKTIASRHGWTFVDFKEALSQVPARDLWAMPGDPHLNSRGHEIMARTLRPYLDL